ncbi:hypothetical protein SAMN05660489_05839 [Pseudomonas sp. LAMO17WK12:I10]|nr:hypothetical protein H160_05832 [Pseudomonas sp. LAMO17WK12:I9]SNY51950.1 hypothetical protein SAMN05660489_05839 [Pseudomonas sp. LAMO17WK12:I10]
MQRFNTYNDFVLSRKKPEDVNEYALMGKTRSEQWHFADIIFGLIKFTIVVEMLANLLTIDIISKSGKILDKSHIHMLTALICNRQPLTIHLFVYVNRKSFLTMLRRPEV